MGQNEVGVTARRSGHTGSDFFLAFDSRKTVRLVNTGIVHIGNSRAFPVTTSQKRPL